jgi:hypothetical protein
MPVLDREIARLQVHEQRAVLGQGLELGGLADPGLAEQHQLDALAFLPNAAKR